MLPVKLSVFQILVRVVTGQSSSELCCKGVQERCHVFIMPHQIYSEVNIGAINHVSGCWVAKILVGGHVLVTGVVVVLTGNFLTVFFYYFRGYKIRNPFFFFCCELEEAWTRASLWWTEAKSTFARGIFSLWWSFCNKSQKLI